MIEYLGFWGMEGSSNGEERASWTELYNINLMPSEFFVKFRKEIEGFRAGLNLEVLFISGVKNLFLLWIVKFRMVKFQFYCLILCVFLFLNN